MNAYVQRILKLSVVVVLAATVGCSSTKNEVSTAPEESKVVQGSTTKTISDEAPQDEESRGVVHQVLLWVPNRILDVFDIVRLRIRVGFGIGAGVRATQIADLYAGTYTTVYVGLPGPRGRRIPRLPFGLESYHGAKASVVDATVDGGIGPHYSSTEFGISLQLLLIGFDIGVDPIEAVDFVGGIFFWDPRKDDL